MGPLSQVKKMFAKTRVIATILVLVSITCFSKNSEISFQHAKLKKICGTCSNKETRSTIVPLSSAII